MNKMLIAFACFAALAIALIGYMAWHVGESRAIDNYQPTAANGQAGAAGQAPPSKNPGGAGSAAGQYGGGEQVLNLRAMQTGSYDSPTLYAKAGVPIKFQFTADANSGCGRLLIIDKVGVQLVSRSGEVASATFTAQPGTYAFHCGMNMFRGNLVVA